MTRLDRLVADLFAAFDVDAAMADIGALVDLDRLQASRGIEQAAERVAERATGAGCHDVEIARFPADGQTHWWTFRAPRSYTPLRASLELADREAPPLAAYPELACSLAAYSAASEVTAPLVRHGSGRDLRGAIAVVAEEGSLPLAIEQAERAGAVGVVSDVASRHLPAGEVGRIELPIDTRLFAFSVTPAAMASALEAADAGGLARATVVLRDADACMPVVTATIGEGDTDEVWLQAHLCHRSPGANDNLSGTAALLGIARAARATRTPGGRVRLVWMPEFVGTAAFLHRAAGEGKLPVASIDLDMVGEDQRLCGGPLIVERSPDHHPHFLNAVVEHALDALPDSARSYSGAVGVRTWTWRATPFVGASDHALFADRSIGVPAVQLGHWPDRFNHSSADTIDKVDGEELRRAATAAGASAWFVASVDRRDVPSLEDIVFRWGLRRIAEAGSADALAHARDVAVASLAAASASARSERLRRRLHDHAEACGELVGGSVPAETASDGAPLQRCWPGPFNLRALLEASPERTWLLDRMAADRATFPAATALALAVDDASGRAAVVAKAAVSSGLAIDAGFADRFLQCLVDAGWVKEAVECR